MGKEIIHTTYFEPLQLMAPNRDLEAYYYTRYKDGSEMITSRPVEAIAIVEAIDTVRKVPSYIHTLNGTIRKETMLLVLDRDITWSLVHPDYISYGTTNSTCLGIDRAGLTIEDMENEPYHLYDSFGYAREAEDMRGLDKAIMEAGSDSEVQRLFSEARQEREHVY